MGKSLGDYNIEQSSSTELKNIKWTQKKSDSDTNSKKKKKISPTNIIYAESKSEPIKQKTFKIVRT